MRKITKQAYLIQPDRYELRKGTTPGAPLCPYGNHYQWVGYDIEEQEYVRFTKSVFKKIIQQVSEK